MANEEAKLRDSLHRHLMEYRGQALTYEMVRKLMSFVFDMVSSQPGIAWISKDSHIRLLNGLFKRVGQAMDDKYTASLEDSIWSSLIINPQPDILSGAGRLAKLLRPAGRQTEVESKAAFAPASQASIRQGSPQPPPAADTKLKGNEKTTSDSAYQRVLLDLAIFENRISRAVDAQALESREADKRLMEERIELEARLSRERAELEAGFARERAQQDARHAKERADIADFLNHLYAKTSEQSQRVEALLDNRLSAVHAAIASVKENSTSILSEQSSKYEINTKETAEKFHAQMESMTRKLEVLESKLTASAKSRRRMMVLWALSLAVTAAGFYAVLFMK